MNRKLSISNIAWLPENDGAMYELLQKSGFCGLEIAPTRIFPENPYGDLKNAEKWSRELSSVYGLKVPSMQSIWFGRTEKVFGDTSEREALIEYTQKAIDFAESVECRNLVFGCPRNRAVPEGMSDKDVKDIETEFFGRLADYAASREIIIGMEANPPMYNTNYINDTKSAIDLVKQIDSRGFGLNLDIGTMIANEESLDILKENVGIISHVHISEPGLAPVAKRELHKKVLDILDDEEYGGFISIEMGKGLSIEGIDDIIKYVAGL